MRVGIVGAGITGLSLLHCLAERGVDAVCFEASDEPGGVIRSDRVDGSLLERGPQRLRLSEPVASLVEAVGLDDQLLVADDSLPIYVYADGRLRRVPRSIRSFLSTDLLSPLGKLRVLAEPLTAPGHPDETAAELFARKFGREAYRNLIGPLFGGMYASDPARMPARHALTPLLLRESEAGSLLRAALSELGGETPPPASFRDGLQALPRALADCHGDRVRLSTPVDAVRPGDESLVLETAGGESAVDRVVVTAAAPDAAELFEDAAPDAADRLRSLTYNPLALVHLRSDADAPGFGYQVRRKEGLHTLGVTWNGSLFGAASGVGEESGAASAPTGREGVSTAFLGGMTDPGVLDRSDDQLGELAAREFESVTGEAADAVGVTRLPRGFPAYDRSWDALDGLALPPGVSLATNYTARMGIPGRVRQAEALAASLADGAGE